MPHLARIRRGLLFIGVFFALSVTGHMWVTGEGMLDSIYFFVVTVSTVGYAEKSQSTPAVKLLNMSTILIGTTAVGYTIGLIVQMMVEGKINEALGIKRMTREINQLSNHAIICGFGRIGQTLATELNRRGRPFVVVDNQPEGVNSADGEPLLIVAGDAMDEETLIEAGIERATTFVVALPEDADNVFLTLTARNMNPNLRIIARGEQKATEKKLRQAGANEVVLPAVIGARRMAAMVTRPHAAEMLAQLTDHESLDVDLEELAVPDDSPLVGKTVREAAGAQEHKMLVIGIRRSDGKFLFNPNADDDFRAGDTLVIMGKHADVQVFKKTHDCREAM